MGLTESGGAIGWATNGADRPDNGNGLTRRQIAAIRKANVLGAGIVRDCPEDLLRLFRDLETPKSHLDIAAELIPEVAKTNPSMARTAVAVALRTLLPAEEHAQLSQQRSTLFIERTVASLDPQTYRDHQANAARAKNAKVPAHLRGRSLVEGRGMTRWTPEERKMVEVLAACPEFQHACANRRRKGTPNAKMITDFINRAFHKGESVRTLDSVREIFKGLKTASSTEI
jgi:hypothetical protein